MHELPHVNTGSTRNVAGSVQPSEDNVPDSDDDEYLYVSRGHTLHNFDCPSLYDVDARCTCHDYDDPCGCTG